MAQNVRGCVLQAQQSVYNECVEIAAGEVVALAGLVFSYS
jgi:hypothetical protein